MEFISDLLQNRVFMAAATGWLVAQVLKTIIDMCVNKSFDPERLVGSGGMPSSHSATVCAMVVATGRLCGVGSTEFAIAAVLSIIVMYDAMGVRYETGEQAKLLNRMFSEWIDQGAVSLPFLRDKKLKEMVGHTPIEVLTGAVLGVVLGFAMPMA